MAYDIAAQIQTSQKFNIPVNKRFNASLYPSTYKMHVFFCSKPTRLTHAISPAYGVIYPVVPPLQNAGIYRIKIKGIVPPFDALTKTNARSACQNRRNNYNTDVWLRIPEGGIPKRKQTPSLQRIQSSPPPLWETKGLSSLPFSPG